MSAAVLRLESFTQHRPSDIDPASAQGERKRAYDDGYAQGRQDGINDLASQLRALNGTLEANDGQARQLRQQMLCEVRVMLNAIVDVLGKRSADDRLRHAIAEELHLMADAVPLRRLVLRCDPTLQPLIEEAVAASGVERVTVEEGPTIPGGAELILENAKTVFEPEAITRALHALIAELTEE